ncbi:saccharopine dehydrogenase C-terminal domain-containing protein [Limibacter armeniacum]|uniref:saccharopine dehydrogenase family protein n=1 Tax=Limibacter armeniacum TaxID=466084 RepID=UPI002FE5ABBB
MHKIFIIGAGRSASSLISHLQERSLEKNWKLVIGDFQKELAESKAKNHPHCEAIFFDANDATQRKAEISQADIVISMLPASMHYLVAKDCIALKKHLITASYVSKEIEQLHQEAIKNDVLLLNEIGLDPGIDHMSAMQMIKGAKDKGYHIEAFESFAGGLLAPESENNPWKYKFTWNPRNVVLAGHGGAVKFLHNGRYKYIPYNRVFRRTEIINIDGYGRFEGYANRDSLKYIEKYGLQNTPTVYRGTLRRPGFCRAWDCFVKIGATDDSYIMENSENMTYREFINSFLAYNPNDSVELKLMYYLKIDQDSDVIEKLHSLDIFSDKKVGLKNATPAQILQKILEDKWTLAPTDKDMIVMYHKLVYGTGTTHRLLTSHMVIKGDDQVETAMAKTVGWPMAIATELLLDGKISMRGVQIPIHPEIYEPVLSALAQKGIVFQEHEIELDPQQMSSL